MSSGHGPGCNCQSQEELYQNVECGQNQGKESTVTDIIKEIKIFDAILHAIVAWQAIHPQCIIKCFDWNSITDNNTTTFTSIITK